VRARRWLFLTLAGLALLLVAGRWLSGVYAEWTWYVSMDALPLYKSRLMHQAALRGGAAIAGFLLAFANLYAVRRSIVSLVLPRRLANLEIGEAVPGRALTGLVVLVSVVVALLLALPQDDWTVLALARIGEPFNELDPYNDLDFGFYVYRLPFERTLFLWALVAVLVVSAVVVFLYAITPSLRWERGKLYISTYVRRHFAVLFGLVLGLVGWSYRIDSLSLLANGSGTLGAFTAFDHSIALPLLTGLSLGSFVGAVVVMWSAWHGYHRVTLTILTLMILAGPVARAVLPALARWKSTETQRRSAERPYVSTRTQFTRRAYGVDEILDGESSRAGAASREELARGVSSWDPAAIVRVADLERRGLSTVATGWEPAPGGLSAAIVQRPSSGSGPWTLSLTDVTSADERGRALPRIRPPSESAERGMPAVLFEPGASAYAVVADSLGEVRAPPFSSWRERLMHAWRLQTPRLLMMDPPAPRPKVLFHRDIRERIAAVAPFLTIGPTLQAAVRGDSLYWIAELFSTSGEYPLSEPLLFAGEERHYVHHAATAVVQAQTGRVILVADAVLDPMARSWAHRFPWLFVSRSMLSPAVAAIIPPAVDWATVQGEALARTGFSSGSVFPRRLAGSDDSSPDLTAGGPTLFALRTEHDALQWSVGVLDAEDRVVGAIVARGGEAPHTEWRRATADIKWRAVLEQLLSAATDAAKHRPGTIERRGHVQLLPLQEGFAFAQSFYRWPSDAAPELLGVAVLDGDRVRTGPTVAEALGLARPASVAGTAAFRMRVAALYDAMSAAMRRGDWTAFGIAYMALGRLLRAAP
jgi:uncharacterized membrane protein (UPF0182 family)